MNEKRRCLKGNLKPNHFFLTDEDLYNDQNTSVPAAESSLNTIKFKSLNIEVQKANNRMLERIKELKNFNECCRDLNHSDINEISSKSLCAYLEGLNNTLKQFESMLTELDTKYSDIVSMRNNFENLSKLIAKGKNLIESEAYRDSIEVCAEALEIKPSNRLFSLGLLYDRAFASSKIGNFRNAIADCTEALLIDPIHTETRLLRAECNFYLDDFEGCILDYEVALSTTELRKNPEKATVVRSKLQTATIELRRKQAEAKNKRANEHFDLKNYRLAEELYSEAIDMWCDNIIYRGNRCTCLIMLGNYERALEDSQYIISMDDKFSIGYDRLIRCLLVYGRYDDAELANKKCHENCGFHKKEYMDLCTQLRSYEHLATQSYTDKQFLSAILHIDRGLQVLPESIHLKLSKAECFMCLGEIEEIQQMEQKWDFSYADQFYLKSLCFYYEGNLSDALTQLKQSLTADPSHTKAKIMQSRLEQQSRNKMDGDISFSLQKFSEAVEYYTKALDMEYFDNGFVYELLCSRASAQSKIGNFREAINDCGRALILHPSDVNMRLLQANCYYYVDDFENAIKDFEQTLTAEEVQMNTKQTEKIKLRISDLKKALKWEEAKKRKSDGDKLVRIKKYEDALECFTKAIDLWPENISFYKDRANCYMNLYDYGNAIKEYQSMLTIDGGCSNAYYGIIKCYLLRGETSGAETFIDKFNSSISKNDAIVRGYQKNCADLNRAKSLVNLNYDKKLYASALSHLDEVLKIATASDKWKLLKAECLALIGRFKEANEIATSCLKSDISNADAIYVYALCLNQKDSERGMEHMQRVIKFNPDHEKAKAMLQAMKTLKQKEETGNSLLQQGKYREAISNYSEAIAISPIENAIVPKILYNRAVASSKIGFIRDAINDCTTAIKKSWTYTQFLKLRAKCHMNMRNFRKVVEDYEALVKIEKSNETEEMLRKARFALERSQSDNYYDILEIDRTAAVEDIKKSYKKLALIHHPDKHSNASDNETKEQQEIFKKISVAYEVLSDPVKRRAYDRKIKRN